ncbi:MAG: hypothetical protein R3Y19_03655, partial [Rikenellaceae bacterium]
MVRVSFLGGSNHFAFYKVLYCSGTAVVDFSGTLWVFSGTLAGSCATLVVRGSGGSLSVISEIVVI